MKSNRLKLKRNKNNYQLMMINRTQCCNWRAKKCSKKDFSLWWQTNCIRATQWGRKRVLTQWILSTIILIIFSHRVKSWPTEQHKSFKPPQKKIRKMKMTELLRKNSKKFHKTWTLLLWSTSIIWEITFND